MNLKKTTLMAGTFLLIALMPTLAAAADVRGIIRLGGDFGGDKLLPTLTYSDGSESTVTAGRGLLLSVGGVMKIYEADAHSIQLEGLLGVKYATIVEATNANADWTRWPIEALVLYGYKGLRLGGGLTYHTGNTFEGSGVLDGILMEFDSALGAVAKVEYWLGPKLAMDFRYTMQSYQLSTGAKTKFNADSMGFGLTIGFGGPSTTELAKAPAKTQ